MRYLSFLLLLIVTSCQGGYWVIENGTVDAAIGNHGIVNSVVRDSWSMPIKLKDRFRIEGHCRLTPDSASDESVGTYGTIVLGEVQIVLDDRNFNIHYKNGQDEKLYSQPRHKYFNYGEAFDFTIDYEEGVLIFSIDGSWLFKTEVTFENEITMSVVANYANISFDSLYLSGSYIFDRSKHSANFLGEYLDISNKISPVVVPDWSMVYYQHNARLLPNNQHLISFLSGPNGGVVGMLAAQGNSSSYRRVTLPESWLKFPKYESEINFNPQHPVTSKPNLIIVGKRLIVLVGGRLARWAYSDDFGRSWSELEVLMVDNKPVRDVKQFFMSDSKFVAYCDTKGTVHCLKYNLRKGGFDQHGAIAATNLKIESGAILTASDGDLLVVMNSKDRSEKSFYSVGGIGHRSWSNPNPLPMAVAGKNVVAVMLADGRVVLSYQDRDLNSPFWNSWVLWCGSLKELHTNSGNKICLMRGSDDKSIHSSIAVDKSGNLVLTAGISTKNRKFNLILLNLPKAFLNR